MMDNSLMQALGLAGNVLDTPGAFLRTLLAGRNPMAGLLDPTQRSSGRDMLESWGWLDPNQEGLDLGDAAGFGAELLTDPLNLFGGLALRKILGNRSAANAAARQGLEPALLDAQQQFRLAQDAAEAEAVARSVRSVPPGYGPVSGAIDNLNPALLKDGLPVRDPFSYNHYKELRVGKDSQVPVQELLEGFGVGGRTAQGNLELIGPPRALNVPGLEQRNAWVGAEALTPPPVMPSRYTPFPEGLADYAALTRQGSQYSQQKLQEAIQQMLATQSQAGSTALRQSGILGGGMLGSNALARSSPYLQAPPELMAEMPGQMMGPDPTALAGMPAPEMMADTGMRDQQAQEMMAMILGQLEGSPEQAIPQQALPPSIGQRDQRAQQMMQLIQALTEGQTQPAPPMPQPFAPPSVPMPKPLQRRQPAPWRMEVVEGAGPNRQVYSQSYPGR